ncbi:unnamed protein product [Prorocentrum cordatum]|uniref:Alpha-galactosidase n=1 Tax=Prorocentrum cordatum TaxID=2364126 RepID=A0ABN9ULC7_9DINO|nr:unnamed protein product [Polarella glacialis]
MLRAMDAVLDKSRKVDGTRRSLKELGFSWVSMDDGWQQCNCSTRQAIDPGLPNCSIGDCRSGHCSWHDKMGEPLVNSHRFPNGMKSIVDHGHSHGLKVGTYLNNCICMEEGHAHYEQDVEWMMSLGFDGVKIDNCGSSHNVSRFAELFNKTGKPIRIEDCHTSPNHPHIEQDGSIDCPMNMYRSGGDIAPNFDSVIGEIYSTVPYSDRSIPLSRPGCWAYPDMMQIGNFEGKEPLRTHQEMSHFGLWCIVSSPLVLGFDMGDQEAMDRVWPTITNPDALLVNQEWAGHPGTLVKAYPASDDSGLRMVARAPCPEGSAPEAAATVQGWRFDGPRLVSPDGLCLHGKRGVDCPPATTRTGDSQCGLALANCSSVPGAWRLDATSGALEWRQKPDGAADGAECLASTPGVAAHDRDVNGRGPVSAQVSLGKCPPLGHFSNSSVFHLRGGLLRVGSGGACLASAPQPGVQLWAKPLQRGRVAALLLNPLTMAQSAEVPLADLPGTPCRPSAGASCLLRDVWARQDAPLTADRVTVHLAAHESAFYILSRGGAAPQPFVAVV